MLSSADGPGVGGVGGHAEGSDDQEDAFAPWTFHGGGEDPSEHVGYAPIHTAAAADDAAGVEALASQGAAINRREPVDENTALHLAAGAGHHAALQALLAAGAGVGLCNAAGDTALHCAAAGSQLRCVQLLSQAPNASAAAGCRNSAGLTAADLAGAFGLARCPSAGGDLTAATGGCNT